MLMNEICVGAAEPSKGECQASVTLALRIPATIVSK